MLLAIDAGNTQTVLGLWDLDAVPGNGGLVAHWRVSTESARTADELAMLVSQLLSQRGYQMPDAVSGVAISSTVPRVQGELREMVSRWHPVKAVIVGPGTRTGMPVRYHDPSEVGADRIANSVAALDRYGAPAVVVDFGTATTFDAISASGEYLGGAIVPGVEISLEALFDRASLLRRVELVEPGAAIGRSMAEAIQSGTLYGFAAQADGLCRRFLDELGPATVVSTGGLGSLIAPHCSLISAHDPWLTLHGLRLLFERNA